LKNKQREEALTGRLTRVITVLKYLTEHCILFHEEISRLYEEDSFVF